MEKDYASFELDSRDELLEYPKVLGTRMDIKNDPESTMNKRLEANIYNGFLGWLKRTDLTIRTPNAPNWISHIAVSEEIGEFTEAYKSL